MSPVEAERRRLADFHWEPDEIELFLFSAACWLPHRIHYDHGFAQNDGHPNVVVHGPLQIARLVEAASGWARSVDGRISAATFRHVSSAYVGDRLQISLNLVVEPAGQGTGTATIEAAVTVVAPEDRAGPATTGTLSVEAPPELLQGVAQ
jgi:hydroxyacyl-ACP dehydratase HTD2-like protein with hotdog domain